MNRILRQCLWAAISFLFCTSAHAQLIVCNHTSQKIFVAIHHNDGNGWHTQGWWGIFPSRCSNVADSLDHRFAYYYFAKRDDGTEWAGSTTAPTGCVSSSRFDIQNDACNGADDKPVRVREIAVGNSTKYILRLSKPGETVDFSNADSREKACQLLTQTLNKPKMRSEKIRLASYTDIFTPPQTKTECTNVYDTGVPDLSTCSTSVDPCGNHQSLPFGGWTCLPSSVTRCTNIKACNTWATYKKQMQCDLTFQLKLPDFVERPVSDFIDNSFQVIETARNEVATSIPLACAPDAVQQGVPTDGNVAAAMGRRIADELKERAVAAIRHEAEEWLKETAIETIASSIPTGGIGGAAALSTQLASFIYRTQKALKPILDVANDVKDYAEDIGFGTSCGWDRDWHRF
ncbi:DUF1036 domain-containing protein [Paraburkholderia caledonica]|uniref:DUF1036 domain-containing protein n=1 Tax=Paraburkholderia caledonica TaxID=134536 RepID=UPI00039B1C69|nr:DUF1036 domain-containing protein [Paraburkholderia caledonica]